MKDEIKEKLKELYDYTISRPKRVQEIFEDFYGEERVDLIIPSFDEFIAKLSRTKIGNLITPSLSVFNAKDEDKEVIKLFWEEGAGNETLTEDFALCTYFTPLVKDRVGELFSDIHILIYFPIVTITNENERSHTIEDLWVKVPVQSNGTGKSFFGMNRSSYTRTEFSRGYLHSHVSDIPRDDPSFFSTPCTGSGPINRSLATLAVEYNESIWRLLCLEIDRFTRVESLEGTPYHNLENVISNTSASNAVIRDSFSLEGFSTTSFSVPNDFKLQLRRFLLELLKSKKIPFNYINNSYGIAMPFVDFVVFLSNEFIEWRNTEGFGYNYEEYVSKGIIQECMIKDGKIYLITRGSTDTRKEEAFIGRVVCVFKGREILTSIKDKVNLAEEDNNKVRILSLPIINRLVKGILTIVNFGYGKPSAISDSGEGTERGDDPISTSVGYF